jgi:hypothetical protein
MFNIGAAQLLKLAWVRAPDRVKKFGRSWMPLRSIGKFLAKDNTVSKNEETK